MLLILSSSLEPLAAANSCHITTDPLQFIPAITASGCWFTCQRIQSKIVSHRRKTGCDTTSALFHKGKTQVFKMFEKRPDLHPAAHVFMQENCPLDELICNGMKIILAIYGAPKTETSIDNYRYLTFAKSTKLSTAVKLSSLPPTSSAAQQHLCRVYYQVQTWLGKDIDPEQWGWIRKNDILQPVPTQLPPAPDILLNSIFCNCTKGCAGKCSCRKVGLNCSTACGHCHGHSCLNTAPIIAMNDEMDDVESYQNESTDNDLSLDDNVSDTEGVGNID